jgi:hypothetical protein
MQSCPPTPDAQGPIAGRIRAELRYAIVTAM